MGRKFLIIDDSALMRRVLSDIISTDERFTVCDVASNGLEAYEKITKNPNLFDVLLLDINMPDMDGIEFCRTIREHVNCPILFLTARVEEADKISGLIAGGDDYITKPFSLKELSARVDAHLRREQRQAGKKTVITAGGLIINLTEQKVEYEGEEISFSKTEFELLKYLAINKGHVFDRERIYEAVWGYDALGDSTVIKEHIRKIRKKLTDRTGKEYIETIWGMGYRFKG